MALRMCRIVGMVHPRVNPVCLWVTLQEEDFDNSIPNRLALESLSNWDAFDVTGLRAVQMVDGLAKLLNVGHAARTRSSTVQKVAVTPAAIAGVQRSVLWRRTKL